MYYLTETFDSAAFIYAQNPTGKGFSYTYRRARSNQPLLYSNFQWNMLYYPEKLVATVGNLVYYNCELTPLGRESIPWMICACC